MLLQSHTGIVRIFPAIPGSWENVSFRTLRTEGAFLVSATRKNGNCTHVIIRAEKGGTLRLVDPFADDSGQRILEIKMEAGETSVLKR